MRQLVPNSVITSALDSSLPRFMNPMEFYAYPSNSFPSSQSSSSSTESYSSFGFLVNKIKEFARFAVSAVVGNLFSAIFTFFFALGEQFFAPPQFLDDFTFFRLTNWCFVYFLLAVVSTFLWSVYVYPDAVSVILIRFMVLLSHNNCSDFRCVLMPEIIIRFHNSCFPQIGVFFLLFGEENKKMNFFEFWGTTFILQWRHLFCLIWAGYKFEWDISIFP